MAAGRFSVKSRSTDGSSSVTLDELVQAVSDDVGYHWMGLIDTLGLDSRTDVQKIKHECTRQEGGTGDLQKRCANHMLAIWKARILSSGIPERDAKKQLLYALEGVPALEHVAERVRGLIGEQEDPCQTTVSSDPLFESGVYSLQGSELLSAPIESSELQLSSENSSSDSLIVVNSLLDSFSTKPIRVNNYSNSYSTQSGGQFDSEAFMDKFSERFLHNVDSHAIVLRLEINKVISEGVAHTIKHCTIGRGNAELFLHLKNHADPDSISKLCDVMRSMDGYPRMSELGRAMKEELDLLTDDDPTFDWDYQEALKKHSKVSVQVIRSLLVGPSGVGKSSLRHLLVHGKSKEITTSTPVMETPDVMVVGEHYAVDDENSIWKQVTDNCLHDSLKQCTRERRYEESPHYPSTIGSSSSDVRAENIVSHRDSYEPSTTQSIPDDRLQAKPKEVNHLEAAREAVLSSYYVPEEEIPLQNTKFIHVIDSGGQPAFQDILPLLLAIPCVYLQIFDASKSFHERIRTTYRPESGSEQQLPSAYPAETHWEFIQRALSSMQTMAYKFKCRDLQNFSHTPPEFRVIFVGTFKDKIEETHRVDEMKASIERSLCSLGRKPYFYNVHFPENEQFFLVDNHMTLHSSQADQKTASRYLNKLRECISDPRYALKVDVPLMWFLVQIITRSSDKKFIEEAELKEFCLKHQYIDQDRADKQFPCLLRLFHFFGFFAHYDLDPRYLKDGINYVCTDATLFYKEVSKLLAVQYSSPKSGATMAFRRTGVIGSPYDILFNELNISSDVDPVWFLEVLHHLGIAARLESNISHTPPSYFIPSCLPYRYAQVPDNCSVGPLCLTYIFEKDPFNIHCDLPRSVFCRLVVELANMGWKIITQDSNRTLIKFAINKTHVYVMERSGHIHCELVVSEPFFPKNLVDRDRFRNLHKHCSTLYGTLLSTLEHITREVFGEQFQKGAQIHPVLPCACQGNMQYTARMTDYKDCLVTCFLCGGPQRLSPRQKVWFVPLESTEARVLLQNGVPHAFWNLEESNGAPRNTCGMSSMLPSKDIDKDSQSSLNRPSPFQGARLGSDSSPMRVHSTEATLQVLPTRNASTQCSPIGQGIFPGGLPESDSSSVKTQLIEDTSQVIPTRDASTLSSAIGQSILQDVLSEPDPSLGQPSVHSTDVTKLFERFKGEFLDQGKVPARSIAQRLYDDRVIPQDIQKRIEHAFDDYNAASILYNHMKLQANGETAEKLFNIMIHNAGYCQMNDLGRKMMECLSKTAIPRGVLRGDTLSIDLGQNNLAMKVQFDSQPKKLISHAATSTGDTLSTSNTVYQSTINDKTPSDFGIKWILLHVPQWWALAGRLGVPIDQVKDYRKEPIMGGDQALAYWRDGRCGRTFPTTWMFLLESVEELRGPQVAKKLREKAEQEETWSQ